ncbi:hypothetical protein CEXT_813381, partial [Caerostris extrusa]
NVCSLPPRMAFEGALSEKSEVAFKISFFFLCITETSASATAALPLFCSRGPL